MHTRADLLNEVAGMHGLDGMAAGAAMWDSCLKMDANSIAPGKLEAAHCGC